MKLCGDCRWVAEPTPHTDLRLCLHPVSGVYRRTDAVTGKESAEPMTCWLNRGLGP